MADRNLDTDSRNRAAAQMAALVGRTISDLHRRSGGVADNAQAIGHVALRLWTAGQNGAVCLPLAELAADDPGLPAALSASPVVQSLNRDDAAASHLPIVVQAGLVYTLKHWRAEQTIAVGLLAQASRLPLTETRIETAKIGAAGDVAQDPLQSRAVQIGLERSLLVLSGGPGTGKTTTLGRLVRATWEQAPDCRIALAAPTGKAAARLAESITALESTGIVVSGTLHRLLGMRADGGFTYGRNNPLPYDLVIVDECSMVDATMGARLISALAPTARLVLAGDHNQLSSVEPGAFFGAVCAVDFPPVSDCIVVLQTNYRQSEAQQIVAWADAVKNDTLPAALPATGQQVFLFERDAVATSSVKSSENTSANTVVDAVVEQAVAGYAPLVRQADGVAQAEAAKLLDAFQSLRVLAVLRSGPFGVDSLNERIARRLRALSLSTNPSSGNSDEWFAGRLVIVTRNMSSLGLFNGDIGLAIRAGSDSANSDDGKSKIDAEVDTKNQADTDSDDWRQLTVIFNTGGSVLSLLPLQMPPHADAFVLSVHQSQGSDFEEVILLPAPAAHPLATRSSLYTAITRARSRLTIHASAADLRAASATGDRADGGLTGRICTLSSESGKKS